MDKRPKKPTELSEPIIWNGPNKSDRSWAMHGNKFASLLLQRRPKSELDERRKTLREDCMAELMHIFAQRMVKLELLAKYRNIDVEQKEWGILLALDLAEEMFTGFSVEYEKKSGRPKVWTWQRYGQLISDIENIKAEKNCGDREACKHYVNRDCNNAPKLNSLRSVESRLTEARHSKHNKALGLAEKQLKRKLAKEEIKDLFDKNSPT